MGQAAIQRQDRAPHGGRINLSGETWSARSQGGDAILPGDKVEVIAIDGATAVVAPVTLPPQPLP